MNTKEIYHGLQKTNNKKPGDGGMHRCFRNVKKQKLYACWLLVFRFSIVTVLYFKIKSITILKSVQSYVPIKNFK